MTLPADPGPDPVARADPGHAGNPLKGKTGLRRVINATGYSIDGLRAAWRHENAFRQEAVLAIVLAGVAVVLPVPVLHKLLLVGVLLLVLITELLNSAVEAAVDRDSLEINPLGKRAKDLGSAAVMLALVLAGLAWVAVLWVNFVAGR